MERWDGTVLNINATCQELGPKCLQLLGMHAITGCDTTSYPYGKGKTSALKTLLAGDFQGLDNVLGEVDATSDELIQAAKTYFMALYGQPMGTSLQSARFSLYTKKKKTLQSWPYLRHLPTCCSMYFGPICRLWYGKPQIKRHHRISRLI